MWSIKDACTKGKLDLATGKISAAHYGGRHYFRTPFGFAQIVGEDVFETEEEATIAARAKVAKRIASLEKTLAKMRKNPFALPAAQGDGE
jgi:hypothetical protein